MPRHYELSRYFLAYGAAPLQESYAVGSETLHHELGISPHSRNSHPHITIKSPFSLSRTEYAGLVRNLVEMANGRVIEAVQVCTAEAFSCFRESGTLYLPIGGPKGQMSRILGQFAAWGYPRLGHEGNEPHVTYATRVDPSLIDTALGILSQPRLKVPHKTVFMADRLVLYVKEQHAGEAFWHVDKEIFLRLS